VTLTPRPFLAPSLAPGASELIRAVRWSAAVRLMDSLVHDVRNPLNALAINVEILHEKLSRAAGGEVPASQAKNLQAMREQISRVNGMLGDFARFLAPAPAAPAVLSLSQMLKDAVGVLGHASRRARVKLAVDVPDAQASVEAMDPSSLAFLVLLPVFRAVERTPEDGQVRVMVRDEGARTVLHVQDGGREEGEETEVEQALRAAASEYGVELHVRGPQLRLSFRTGKAPG
jgi:signal transduction histidine kinase